MRTQNIKNEFSYSITHWFQPIYNLKNNNVIGHEALLRDTSPLKVSPANIFIEADKNGHRNILDLISVKKALETFTGEFNQLFINIFPSTILERDFLSWWDAHVPPFTPIVLELLENEPVRNWEELKTVTEQLRARGVKIAVDDMGEGYSFFQQWIELNPDFIKLDRYFVKDLSMNSRKQKTLRSLLDLFADTTKVIIEGVETEEELYAVEQLGISYAQGYLLGMPSPKENFLVGSLLGIY